LAQKTKQFRIGPKFNVQDLNRFFEDVEASGGKILQRFTVQIQSGTVDFYVIWEDATPPEVIRTFPSDGQVNVPAGSNIVILFNEDVTLQTDPVEILKDGSDVSGFTLTETDGRIEISGAIDSVAGSYTVRVLSEKVEDANGNPPDQDFTFAFDSTSDALSGQSIVDKINASTAIIDGDNLEPNKFIRRQIHEDYQRSAGNRMALLGATGVFADDFWADFSDDPGASYTPSTTTLTIDEERMRAHARALGDSATGVYYSEFVDSVGATGVLLERALIEPDGASIKHELIKDNETSSFTTLTPGTKQTISSLSSGFRLRAELVNPGTGGSIDLISHELYIF